MIRYPGGKSRLWKKIQKNNLEHLFDDNETLVSPFCGAAHLELNIIDKFQYLYLCDKDPTLICFWTTVLYNSDWLCEKISNYKPNLKDFYGFKKDLGSIYYVPAFEDDEKDIAFKKLVLHQTSFSGLGEMGGPLGGPQQKSKYKIDCRWSTNRLIKKIERIQNFKNKIYTEYSDYNESISRWGIHPKTILFLDPPYYEKSNQLYRETFLKDDHNNLANILLNINTPWILCYDDCNWVRDKYHWANIVELDSYSKIHQTGKRNIELIIYN